MQGPFDLTPTLDAPERIIADKDYDSDARDEEFDDTGIKPNTPRRKSRKRENGTQDRRRQRRYSRRWTTERTISWLQKSAGLASAM